MGANSAIEWTDHTFNPWIGCTKVSPGCKHCYAETLMDERYKRVKWGPQGARVRTSQSLWRKPIQWNNDVWYQCLDCGWRGSHSDTLPHASWEREICPACRSFNTEFTKQRVFCASLADIAEIHPSILPEWRRDLVDLITETPNLDWLLLTKRPENFNELYLDLFRGKLPFNVWVGTSVENQEYADERVPELIKINAKVRFLSVEPLLGPVALDGGLMYDRKAYPCDYDIHWGHGGGLEGWNVLSGEFRYYSESTGDPEVAWREDGIDWVIAGGESGHGARPMHPDWVRSLRDQCVAADIPFFFKQWGEWTPELGGLSDHAKNILYSLGRGRVSKIYNIFDDKLISYRAGKKVAGNLIDGQTWKQFPTP